MAETRKRARIAATQGFHPDIKILDDDGRDWAWAFVVFHEVPGFPGYAVGSDGSVWSRRINCRWGLRDEWRKMKQKECRAGYLGVTLRQVGKQVSKFIHRLVLETFRGPCPPGQLCRHVAFNNRADNRLLNLRWGTPTENQADRLHHGTDSSGGRSSNAKLTEADIPMIRALVASGVPQEEVGRRYGVRHNTVGRIVRRESWKHVP